jgi:uncharacterized Zn-binding protein involved in type VI secretion
MADKGVARKGDTGSHGGTITTGSGKVFVNDRPMARVGDTYACPKHGNNPIISGVQTVFVEGMLAAHVGSKTACGATITSGSPDTFVDDSASVIDKSIQMPEGPLYAAMSDNTVTDAVNQNNEQRVLRFEALPKAPPPLEEYQMEDFHRQAEQQGLGDKKSLAQYHRVENGIASGASNGWTTYSAPINGEAWVYVENINPGLVGSIPPVTVRAGILPNEVQEQTSPLPTGKKHVFRFINRMGKWYISVGALDVYMLRVEVWTKMMYAD